MPTAAGHGGGADGRQPRETSGYGLGAGHRVGVGVHLFISIFYSLRCALLIEWDGGRVMVREEGGGSLETPPDAGAPRLMIFAWACGRITSGRDFSPGNDFLSAKQLIDKVLPPFLNEVEGILKFLLQLVTSDKSYS